MTRVLFLCESFHPVLGGGERQVRALSTSLAEAGFTATVLTRRGELSWPREEWLDGVRVLRVSPAGPGRLGKYLMLPGALLALARQARTYDVIVVRGTRVLGLPGVLAARVLGRPVVLQAEVNGEMSGEVYTWGTVLDRPLPRKLVKGLVVLRNQLLLDADAFVAMSRHIRDELLAAGAAPERIRHIPHGVDTEMFRPATAEERQGLRGRLALPLEGCLVTYTGRLLRGKGLLELVEAFSVVARERSDVHLLLVGSGAGQSLSVESELVRLVGERGLRGRVFLPGRVENVADFLRASDVFAFPSAFEALGLSLVEAAACGLACVGSRTGGIVDVIDEGRSGLLFEPGAMPELSAALRALVESPERRAALGHGARDVALRLFDARDNVDRYRALFSELGAPLGEQRPAHTRRHPA